MNILLLAWNFPPVHGGIEYVAAHLDSGLRAEGHDVTVLARHDPAGSTAPGVWRPARPGLLRHQCFTLVAGWRRMRVAPADILVCAGIVNAPAAWLLARVFRRPWVVLAHGADLAREGRLYRALTGFFFRRANGVAANSQDTRRRLERAGGRPERLRVIHPGVDAARFPAMDPAERERLRMKHGLAGRRAVLSVGRLIRRKGFLTFIQDLLPELRRQIPEVVYLVVGADATRSLAHHERLQDRMRRAVRELCLEPHVRLLGEVDDDTLRELYYAADLFLMPALDIRGDVEGFGIVLLEAALAGLPAVATRVGGIPEAVADGRSGILCAPGDRDGLTAAVTGLLREDEHRRQLAAGARTRALNEFDWPVIIRQYARFLADVAHPGSPA